MKEEIRHIVVGVIKSFAHAGGIQVPESFIPMLTNVDHWHYVDSKTLIINNQTTWCYEFKTPDEVDKAYFLQVELCTHFSTVVSINVITNEEDKVTAYSK